MLLMMPSYHNRLTKHLCVCVFVYYNHILIFRNTICLHGKIERKQDIVASLTISDNLPS